jgi:hypothetical protein
VIENLEDLSVEEVMEQFDVTREQIRAVLEFVAQSLKVSGSGEPSAPGKRASRKTHAPLTLPGILSTAGHWDQSSVAMF